jgi:hypothetical protein
MVETMDEVLKIAMSEPLQSKLSAEDASGETKPVSDDTITH